MRRIDPTLYPVKQGGYDWRSGANSFQARFSDTAGSGFAEFGIGDRTVRLTAVGAAAGEAVVEGSRISYPRAYRSADLTYTVTPSGIKEVIELTGPDAPASFTFRLVADDGPAPSVQRRGDGSYAVVLPPLPGPAFVLEAPVVQESAGEREVAPPAEQAKPQLQVEKSGRDLVVRLSIDRDWLRAPGRRFPVHVDPTMTIQPDSEDASFVAAGNFLPFVNERLFIGSGSTNHWRAALLFDLAGLPVDAQVTGANLGLYFDGWCISASGPFCGGTEHVMDAHRMTGAWSLSSTSDQLSFEAAALSTHTLADSLPQGWMTWPVTATVQGWVSGSLPNFGLLVKRRAEVVDSSGPVPPGRRFTGSPDLQPRLEVTYTSDAVDLLEPATLHGNGADLAWTRYTGPSGAPFSRYEVHRAPGSATFTPSASTLLATITQAGVTTYRDTTAAPEATFTYRVVANESASNPRTVTLPPDGQASKVLQPDPVAGRNTFLYFASGITNCANYGAETGAWLGTTASARWRNALYFDLRDIPANATITQAIASVWQTSGPSTPLTVQAHRISGRGRRARVRRNARVTAPRGMRPRLASRGPLRVVTSTPPWSTRSVRRPGRRMVSTTSPSPTWCSGARVPLIGLGVTAVGIGVDIGQGKPVEQAVVSGVGGAAAGLAVGAAVGSVVPVAGTAVGAVVGAGVGWAASSGIDWLYENADTVENWVSTGTDAVGGAASAVASGAKDAWNSVFGG